MVNKEMRICPNCKAIYKDKNVTVCLKCGYPTVKRVMTKGVKVETPMGK